MSTRLDLVLQKHPDHADGIRLLASRDPSGNLKYLGWGAKILASGQALAPEIADVVELFHRFRGQWHGNPTPDARHTRRRSERQHVRHDIYEYLPQHLAQLRDLLLKMKRASDTKRKKRERLYRIEGAVEADVIYDSPDLIVRHIKNKQASVHYGLSTKWCISMLRENYFEDYEAHNATFFFFERKTPMGDEFDKMALMIPRNGEQEETVEAFTALDRRVNMMSMAKVHGSRIFDIFREIHERSELYPGSDMSCAYSGTATREQLEATFASAVKKSSTEMRGLLESICCNDTAPQALLEEILNRAPELLIASWKKAANGSAHRRNRTVAELVRAVMAAMVIHPNVSAETRAKLVLGLRRRHINIETIRRTQGNGRVEIDFDGPFPDGGRRRHRRYRRRPDTVKSLRSRAKMYDRIAARTRKKARTLQRKLTEKKKKRAARAVKKKPTTKRDRP